MKHNIKNFSRKTLAQSWSVYGRKTLKQSWKIYGRKPIELPLNIR